MDDELMDELMDCATRIANSITPVSAVQGTDANGGSVGSLTEAVMGMTFGLVRIAEAITDLAEAVREREA